MTALADQRAPVAAGRDERGESISLRLAYLTNQYPAVSHTFIRREILELERRGHSVLRLAIRPGADGFVDPVDRAEHEKTLHCLSQPLPRLAAAQVSAVVGRPVKSARALLEAVAMARRSDKGLGKHLAYFAEAAHLLGVLRRENIQHLHVHFGTNPAAVARLIRMLGGPPFSMMVHGPLEFDAPRGLSLPQAAGEAEFVACISDYCSAQVRRWLPVGQWEKVHIVRCTVGDGFLAAARPVSPASKSILCIGRMVQDKGHLVLLEALARAEGAGREARLVFAGDGELRPAIERRIGELGLGGRVEITGWIGEEEIQRRVLESRALALTSFAEGLPVVIMEALALARPVLSTYIAGIPELVRPGENGWLVPAGSVEAAAAAIAEIMSTPVSRLDAMGQAGRALVAERHHTGTEVERLEALFLQSVGARSARGGR
ncbi:MAG: glycosyltransferase [Phycisphaerales bacterium]